jgi:hypothetical protein
MLGGGGRLLRQCFKEPRRVPSEMFNKEHNRKPRRRPQQLIGSRACKRPRSFPSWRKVAIRKRSWELARRQADYDLISATQEIALLSFCLSFSPATENPETRPATTVALDY